MSRYPSATWKPIANRSSKTLQKDLLSVHTMVGPGLGTWNYFNTGAGGRGVYSHILVCGIWGSDAGKDVDGLALQAQDTDLRAAANLDGNWHIISVETADNAARPIAPWTPAQCETLARIMADANRLDGIPLTLVPDSKPGRRGISYHREGCDPYRVAGGELWSTAYGKDCPTQARIDQIPAIIDRARAIVAGNAPAPQEDLSIMDPDTKTYLDKQFAQLSQAFNITIYGDERVDTKPDTHPYNLQALSAKVDALQAAVDAALKSTPPPPSA